MASKVPGRYCEPVTDQVSDAQPGARFEPEADPEAATADVVARCGASRRGPATQVNRYLKSDPEFLAVSVPRHPPARRTSRAAYQNRAPR
jgi:hypothetical protein